MGTNIGNESSYRFYLSQNQASVYRNFMIGRLEQAGKGAL